MKTSKKVLLTVLGCTASYMVFIPNVDALTRSDIVGSWATGNYGKVTEKKEEIGKLQPERIKLENSLYEPDVTRPNVEGKFTGIGFFGEEGVTYTFDKYDENGEKTHASKLVNNPDPEQPDLMLREVTWGTNWIGEGVKIIAVDYNGTGEDKVIGYAYNEAAVKRTGGKLQQVEGTRFENVKGNSTLHDTLIYFGEDFKYCSAIKLVDVTDDLKRFGGQGKDSVDGYDLDAIHAYKVLYVPVDDETRSETAVSVGNFKDDNINCEKSWQKAVMKVKVSDLLDEKTKKFDIVAGQHYIVGSGEIYLNDGGFVSVKYNFNSSVTGIETAKVGIYRNIDTIIKNGKLIGNGKITADEKVTINDEYAYVRLHFDVEIPEAMYDLLVTTEIESVCEKAEKKSILSNVAEAHKKSIKDLSKKNK